MRAQRPPEQAVAPAVQVLDEGEVVESARRAVRRAGRKTQQLADLLRREGDAERLGQAGTQLGGRGEPVAVAVEQLRQLCVRVAAAADGVATLAATIKRKRGAQSLAKSVSFSDDVVTP